MKKFAFYIAILFLQISQAQDLWVETTYHDYGTVAFWNNEPFVCNVKNQSDKTISFLPIFYHQDYKVWFSHPKLEPGQQGQISIVFYSESKGKFDKKIPVYYSSSGEPIWFNLKGQINGFDPNAVLVCPSVNDGPTINQSKLKVEVRDFDTDEFIAPEHLSMESTSGKKLHLYSSNNYYECLINGGQYRIHCNKDKYQAYDALVDIPSYQKKYVVYLIKIPVDPKPPNTVNNEPEIELTNTEVIETEPNEEPVEPILPIIVKTEPEPVLIDTTAEVNHVHTNTLSKEYKYNNIILVADISTSMKYSGKMQSLNNALDVLVDAMRSEDKIGVVTLASTANIVREPAYITQPDSLKGLLNTIKIGGSTNGASALQMAYELALAHYVPNGNNQIIIATDGIFSGSGTSNRALLKLITDYANKGIYLSTIGLNTTEKGELFLQNLATNGQGDYIHLHGQPNAQELLLEMIKNQSKTRQ